MVFDADEYEEAMSAPVVRIHNKPIEGVILSFDEYMPLLQRFIEFKPDDIEGLSDLERLNVMVEYQKLKADFFRKIFPKKFKYRFTIDPVDYLLRQSHDTQEKYFMDFFFSVGAAHGLLLKKN